jgi:hypothetical protein
LRRIGGWDTWNVTEDADVGLRLARFGYRSETLASTTYEEAPATLRAFFNQRRRWCKGWYQTLIVLWRRPRRLIEDLGVARCAGVTLVVAANVLSALAAPLCAIGLGVDAIMGPRALPDGPLGDGFAVLALTVALVGVPAVLWPILLGMKRRGLMRLLPALILLPLYSSIVCVAAWTALCDLARHPFDWSKTQHGGARRGAATRSKNQRSYDFVRFKRKLWLTLSDISI